jgi:hypothetical protein
MTSSDYERPPSNLDETATERQLLSYRPRPPRFTAAAIVAALPAEPLPAKQPVTFRRCLALCIAAAWLGGMITGATALHLMRSSTVVLQVADASDVVTPPPEIAETVVPKAPDQAAASRSPQLLLAQRPEGGPETKQLHPAGRRPVDLLASSPSIPSDRSLRDFGFRAGNSLRVLPRADQRLTQSETATTHPSRSPQTSRHIEQRKPLTPTSYRQWTAGDFNPLMHDARG